MVLMIMEGITNKTMNRDKFSKIAMMFTSPEKNEVLNAVKIANKHLEDNDMTWSDFISGLPTVSKKNKKKEKPESKSCQADCDVLLVDASVGGETEKAFRINCYLNNGDGISLWFPKGQTRVAEGLLGEDIVNVSSWIMDRKNEEIQGEMDIDYELEVWRKA